MTDHGTVHSTKRAVGEGWRRVERRRPTPPLGQAVRSLPEGTEACPYEWLTSCPNPKAKGAFIRVGSGPLLPAPCPDVSLATTFCGTPLVPLFLCCALPAAFPDVRQALRLHHYIDRRTFIALTYSLGVTGSRGALRWPFVSCAD